MKFLICILAYLLGIPSFTFAQQNSAQGAPGCGPEKQKIEVITSKNYSSIQPAAGKALIYVIQDDSHLSPGQDPPHALASTERG